MYVLLAASRLAANKAVSLRICRSLIADLPCETESQPSATVAAAAAATAEGMAAHLHLPHKTVLPMISLDVPSMSLEVT